MYVTKILQFLILAGLISCVGTIQGTQDTQNISKNVKDAPVFEGIIEAHPVSHEAIQVIFDRPKDRSRTYNFSIYVDGNYQSPVSSIDELECNFVNLSSCRVLVRGLQLGKNYRVSVRAQDKKTLVEDENQKTVTVSTLTYQVPIFTSSWDVGTLAGLIGKSALEVRVTNAEPAQKDLIFGGPARADLGVKCYQALVDSSEKGVLSQVKSADSSSIASVCEPHNKSITGPSMNRTVFNVISLSPKTTYYLIVRACDEANRCEQNSTIKIARTRTGEALSFLGIAKVNLDHGDLQNWGFGSNGSAGRNGAILRFNPDEARGDVTGFIVAAVPKGSKLSVVPDASKADGFRINCAPEACISGVHSLTKTSSINCVSKKTAEVSELGCRLQGLTPYTDYFGVVAAIDDCTTGCTSAGETKSLPFITAPEVMAPRLSSISNGSLLTTAKFQISGFSDLQMMGVGAVHLMYREKMNNSFGDWKFFLQGDQPKVYSPNAQGYFEQEGLKSNAIYAFQILASDDFVGISGKIDDLKKPLEIEGLEGFVSRWQKFSKPDLISTQKTLSTIIDWPLTVLDGACLEVTTTSFAFNLPPLDPQRTSYKDVEYQFRAQGQASWNPLSSIYSTSLLSVNTSKKMTLSNLEPGTKYEVRFRFQLGDARSPWSHPDDSQWAVCQTTGVDLAFQDFVQIISVGPAVSKNGDRARENFGFSTSRSRQGWWTDSEDPLPSVESFNKSLLTSIEVSPLESNLSVNGRDVIVYEAKDVNDRALATVSTLGVVKLVFPDAKLGSTPFTASKVNSYDIFRARLASPTDTLNGASLSWLKVGGELVADSSGFVTFVDYTAGVSNVNESVPYAFKVVPVRPGGDISFDPATAALATIRVILPQANMSFVHRRMSNKVVCSRITNSVVVDLKSGSCLLPSGVRIHGAVSRQYIDSKEADPTKQVKTGMLFDIGKHLLFDRYELGCASTTQDPLELKLNTNVPLDATYTRYRRQYEFPAFIQPPVTPFPAHTFSGTSTSRAPVHNYSISPSLILSTPGVSDVANSLQYFKSLAEKNKAGITTYGFIDASFGLVKYTTPLVSDIDLASEDEISYFNFPEPGIRFNAYRELGIAHYHKVAGTNNIPQMSRCLIRKQGEFFYRPLSSQSDFHRFLDSSPDTFPVTDFSKAILATACAQKKVNFASSSISKKLPTRPQQLAFLVQPNQLNPASYNASPSFNVNGCRVNSSAVEKWTGKTGAAEPFTSPAIEDLYTAALESEDFKGLLKVRGVDSPRCKNLYGAFHVWGNAAEWSREDFVCKPEQNTRDIKCELRTGEDSLTPGVSSDGRSLFDSVDLGSIQHYNNSTPNHADGFNPIFGLMNTKCSKAADCGSGSTLSTSPRLIPETSFRFGQSLGFAVTDVINSKARGCHHLGLYGEVMGPILWGDISSQAKSICETRSASYPLSSYARIYGHLNYKDTDNLPVSMASGGDVISNFKFNTAAGKLANFNPYHFSLERSDVPNADVGARCMAELLTND